jgi:predicted nucleotidyltransferase
MAPALLFPLVSENNGFLAMVALPVSVRTTAEEFIRQLNADRFAIRAAFIFGSYAKGQQSEWSDIDLALVSDQFEGYRFNDRCKLSPYVVRVSSDIETHPFRPEDFTEDNPFVKEIIKTGIRIV